MPHVFDRIPECENGGLDKLLIETNYRKLKTMWFKMDSTAKQEWFAANKGLNLDVRLKILAKNQIMKLCDECLADGIDFSKRKVLIKKLLKQINIFAGN